MNQFNPEFEQHQVIHLDDGQAPSLLEMPYGAELDEAVNKMLRINSFGRKTILPVIIGEALGVTHLPPDQFELFKNAMNADDRIEKLGGGDFLITPRAKEVPDEVAPKLPAQLERAERAEIKRSKKDFDKMIKKWQKGAPQAGGKRRSRKGGHKRRPEM